MKNLHLKWTFSFPLNIYVKFIVEHESRITVFVSVLNLGLTSELWGTEIYPNENRYGKYQSYGSIDVRYINKENGQSIKGFNWNFIPGTTTKVLSFDDLNPQKPRSDEYLYKDYNFVGSIRFRPIRTSILGKIDLHGKIGMFVIDFRQMNEDQNEKDYFTFRKSVIAIDGNIFVVGTNLHSNHDHQLVTTIFQLDLNSKNVIVNNETLKNEWNGEGYWILDNFNTGYILSNSNNLRIKCSNQISPHHSGNGIFTECKKYLAYLDHTKNYSNFSYIIQPNSTIESIKSTIEKNPFRIIYQTNILHVTKISDAITTISAFVGPISNEIEYFLFIEKPVLIITEEILKRKLLKTTFCLPKLTFNNQEANKSLKIIIRYKWNIRMTSINKFCNFSYKFLGENTHLYLFLSEGFPLDLTFDIL